MGGGFAWDTEDTMMSFLHASLDFKAQRNILFIYLFSLENKILYKFPYEDTSSWSWHCTAIRDDI